MRTYNVTLTMYIDAEIDAVSAGEAQECMRKRYEYLTKDVNEYDISAEKIVKAPQAYKMPVDLK